MLIGAGLEPGGVGRWKARPLDGIWTESIKVGGKTWKNWKSAIRSGGASYLHVNLSGFPYSPLAMCKIGKLSYVAGAELPKQYLLA